MQTWICVGTVCNKINALSRKSGHTEFRIRITSKMDNAGSM